MTLEMYCDSHWFSHLCMKSAAEHIQYQLPNESTKVQYLLDTIKCNDPDLRAQMANINFDDDPNGKQHNFELTVAYIMPTCPVALCIARRDPIVDNKTASAGSMTLKDGIDRTGVELRWYPRAEYAELSDKQRGELKEFKSSAAGKKQIAANAKKRTQSGGGGSPSALKKGRIESNNSSTLSKKQIGKIAAAVAKVGSTKGKKNISFDKNMAKLSLILVGSNAQALSTIASSSSPVVADEAKMAKVAVVLKSIM